MVLMEGDGATASLAGSWVPRTASLPPIAKVRSIVQAHASKDNGAMRAAYVSGCRGVSCSSCACCIRERLGAWIGQGRRWASRWGCPRGPSGVER